MWWRRRRERARAEEASERTEAIEMRREANELARRTKQAGRALDRLGDRMAEQVRRALEGQ